MHVRHVVNAKLQHILLTRLENLHKFKDRCMLLEENGVISLYILVTVLLLREYATMTPIFQIFLKLNTARK